MKIFRNYIALALVLLITVSATGINISLHKCCGSIQDFSLFGKAKECKMAQKTTAKSCPVKSENSFTKDACCDNQQISLNQVTDKVSPKNNQVKDKEQSFDVLFVYTLFNNWFGSSEGQDQKQDEPSPGLFIVEALILLLQQFRI
ncbi:hypothetical protein ACFSJU_06760 [Paradesertivirga mongoliensis]|uniref:Secreted protein n=1 Tax=Paradesertivirga mongoliensis TaxID=2100740 RepID=A0ABW4ZKC0_9SPHI|nr:hypothetical protein [Pedobacter mongoliensis]